MADITKSPGPAPAPTSRLSLAAKLYSIFALFAVLVAAITVLSDYNSRQNAALTDAVATASRAAIKSWVPSRNTILISARPWTRTSR